MNSDGPVLRVFEARTKLNCAEKLLEHFATTSAHVVLGEPGNRGYFFGRCVPDGENTVIFVSVWKDLAAVKERFGDDWQVSYMPEGYDELIDECSVRHVDMSNGWHVAGLYQSVDELALSPSRCEPLIQHVSCSKRSSQPQPS